MAGLLLLGCGNAKLSVTECEALEVSFDQPAWTLPEGAPVLTAMGSCTGAVEGHELEWSVTGSGHTSQGSQRSACREGRFSLRVPVSEFPSSLTFEVQLAAGQCRSDAALANVTRTVVNAGGGSAGGGVGSGGGVASGGGSAPTTGPGACMSSDVFSFCSAAPRLGRPPDESTLIAQLAAQYPNELNRCARHNDEFKRIALAALRARDPRWGNNLVRGTPGDTNGNVIGYFYGSGAPTEGSPLTMLVEIVSNCETPSPTGARTATWRLVAPQDSDVGRCCQPVGAVGVDAKAWTLLNTGVVSGTGGGSAGGGSCGDAFSTNYCMGSRTPPNESALIQQLAAQHPTEFYNCDRHQDDFLQIVVRALRARDPRWGFNWVRGMTGDSNGDVIGYYYGPGSPTEGSRFTTIVDIVGGCGAAGSGESVTWQVYGEANSTECCAPAGAEAWTMVPLR